MAGFIYDEDGNFVGDAGTPTGTGGGQMEADADAIQFKVPLGGVAFGTGRRYPAGHRCARLWPEGGRRLRRGDRPGAIDFGFGLSVEDGFYLSTNDQAAPEIPSWRWRSAPSSTASRSTPRTVTPFYAEGKLLFFILSVEDIDRDEGEPGFQPSGVFGFLELDIIGEREYRPGHSQPHLITASIEDLFDINFGVEATLNTTMTLDIGDIGLPRLKADFVASWSWDLDNGAGEPRVRPVQPAHRYRHLHHRHSQADHRQDQRHPRSVQADRGGVHHRDRRAGRHLRPAEPAGLDQPDPAHPGLQRDPGGVLQRRADHDRRGRPGGRHDRHGRGRSSWATSWVWAPTASTARQERSSLPSWLFRLPGQAHDRKHAA